MESTFYESLSGSASVNGGVEENFFTLKDGIIDTIRSMDAYQLLGLLIALIALMTTVGFVGASISESSGGYGNGGGELLLAVFWMMLAVGGVAMISGQLDLEGVRALVEQNSAMIIALLVAFVLAATFVEVVAIKTLMS